MAKRSKRKSTKIPGNRLLTLVLVVFILGLSCTMVSQQITMSKLSAEAKTLKQKIQDKEEEKAKIQKELEAPNELERVERIAREQLGMIKPGERVFVDSSR